MSVWFFKRDGLMAVSLYEPGLSTRNLLHAMLQHIQPFGAAYMPLGLAGSRSSLSVTRAYVLQIISVTPIYGTSDPHDLHCTTAVNIPHICYCPLEGLSVKVLRQIAYSYPASRTCMTSSGGAGARWTMLPLTPHRLTHQRFDICRPWPKVET